MKLKPIAIMLVSIVGVMIIYYSFRGEPSPEDYAKEIQQERTEKNEFMKSDPESPFKDEPGAFQGLNYYPPNLAYKIKASIITIEDKKVLKLPASDGKENEYLEFGYAKFKLKGQEIKLLLLEITEAGPTHGTLFLAFADSTSARETYGSGRYLELKKIGGMSSITLDFNKAYNPYCAYNDRFSCPMPPRENIMTVAIAAGEKSYH